MMEHDELLMPSFHYPYHFSVHSAVLKRRFRTIDQSYLAENLSTRFSPGKARDNYRPHTPRLLIYPH